MRDLVTVVVALALAGCGARSAALPPDFERLAEVAAAARTDASLLERESTLAQAALAHAVPHAEMYDPVRAAAYFERLLDQYPRSAYAPLAHYLLPLLRHAGALESELDAERRAAETTRTEIAELRADIARLEGERTAGDQRTMELSTTIGRLQALLSERETRIRRMEEQLQGLMEIDLGPARPPSPDDPTLLPTPPPR